MPAHALAAAKRLLKSPAVIVGELAALAAACALGAALPQAGTAGDAGTAWWDARGPVLSALRDVLALDRVFRSGWFLALCMAAAASLSAVVYGQFRRALRLWKQPLTEQHFRAAPFQAEFERPARLAGAPSARRIEIWSERRIGLAGSAVFHAGLLAIVLAGAGRALLATEAVVDLVETEVLPPEPSAWAAQFPGLLARPFRLDRPVTLTEVRTARYGDGSLRELSIALAAPGKAARRIEINTVLRAAGGRIFLDAAHGPAALLEWRAAGAEPLRERVHLAERGPGRFEGASEGPGGLVAHLRAGAGGEDGRPAALDVRVMRGSALLLSTDLASGDTVSLPGGAALTLHGLPLWARLRGSRDPALGLAFAGLALAMAGSAAMFLLVRVDACVAVTPADGRERVFVALRPQRFAPMFRERFERLAREQGSPA
jgi:hypothetical protein